MDDTKRAQPRSVAVILVAAGRGERFGAERPKQFVELLGQPLFLHSFKTLARSRQVGFLVLVVTPGWERLAQEAVDAAGLAGRVAALVPGGATRQDSVWRGLQALPETELVLVHDAARPCLPEDLIDRAVQAARRAGAAVAALPVADTLMRQGDGGEIPRAGAVVERRGMWAVQTPQVFDAVLLRQAHDEARKALFEASDDGTLVLRLHRDVELVPGDRENLKVTTAADLEIARLILQRREQRGEDGSS